MAPTTTDLQPIERDVLDHFKEGVGTRTIAMRVNIDHTEVQEIIVSTAGGDRTKAGALVADYDRRHGITPTEKPIPWTPTPDTPALPAPSLDPPSPAAQAAGKKKTRATPARRAAAEVLDVAGIPAPTVMPVTLTETAPAASHYDPATGRAPDLPLEPPSATERDAPPVTGDELTWKPDDDTDQGDERHQDGDGDAWADLDLAMSPVIAQAAADLIENESAVDQCTHGGDCHVHPKTQGLHNFDVIEADRVAALLAGPREQLPAVKSFESLIAAVQQAGDRSLRELAAQVAAMVDQLHDGYARERQIRLVRAEVDQLRRDLDARIAMLTRLAAGETPTA